MHPTANGFSFNLFGFQTSIQPFFWLVAILITAIHLPHINNDMPIWLAKLFVGVIGVALSILVHELGHAFSFRHLFNTRCAIVLHGLGGLAIPLQSIRHSYGFNGAMARCFLSFSGPLAGFVLAAVTYSLLSAMPPAGEDDGLATVLLRYFLGWTTLISIIWGIFNLLPIYPMDGGHIAREVFQFFFPRQGVEYSLMFSMVFSITLAVSALLYMWIFGVLIFGYFAYLNYQELTSGSLRR